MLFRSIANQAENIASDVSGFTYDVEEAKEDVKWLFDNGCLITKDNLETLHQLNVLEQKKNDNILQEYLLEQASQGVVLEKCDLKVSQYMECEAIVNAVSDIIPESINGLLNEGKDITIQNLSNFTDSRQDLKTEINNVEAIEFKRQLEEIKLNMTTQVANHLYEKGIDIGPSHRQCLHP